MHPLEILLKLGLFAKRVLDEHLFLQRRLRRKVFALIHNRKAPSWEWSRDGAFLLSVHSIYANSPATIIAENQRRNSVWSRSRQQLFAERLLRCLADQRDASHADSRRLPYSISCSESANGFDAKKLNHNVPAILEFFIWKWVSYTPNSHRPTYDFIQ